jgi:hypothetical protein
VFGGSGSSSGAASTAAGLAQNLGQFVNGGECRKGRNVANTRHVVGCKRSSPVMIKTYDCQEANEETRLNKTKESSC